MPREVRAVPRVMCKSVQTLPSSTSVNYKVRPRPHSLDADCFDVPGHSIVPCHRVTVRSCDEPYEEFRRAGIGACFRGRNIYFNVSSMFKEGVTINY